jgi:hypothetical protein
VVKNSVIKFAETLKDRDKNSENQPEPVI